MHRRHHSASVRIAAGCAAALWLLSISGCTRQGPEDQQSIAGASGTVAGAGTGGQSGSRGAAAAPVQGGAGAGAGAAAAPSTAGAGAGGGGAGASGGGAGASGSAQEADAATPPEDAGPTVSPFPPAGDLVAAGPYTSTTVSNSGPNGNYTIYHPAELAPGGARNPIVGWMSGGSTNPALYTLLPHLASHGFVVVASNTVPAIGEEVALGQEIIAGIDWILEQNGNASSPFFEKLDATKVASMGYSMGALATTTIADDPRLTTTVHISGGNMVTERIAKLHAPAAFFCGAKRHRRSELRDRFRRGHDAGVLRRLQGRRPPRRAAPAVRRADPQGRDRLAALAADERRRARADVRRQRMRRVHGPELDRAAEEPVVHARVAAARHVLTNAVAVRQCLMRAATVFR